MRVIAGSRRGMKLAEFEGNSVRPTTDRIKENIFNILTPYVPEARVLDLFAGSGALAIEALSRGACSAVLCDSARSSIALIQKNVSKADFIERVEVLQTEALAFLRGCRDTFDLIFLDPPYNTGLLQRSLELIAERNLLAKGGIVLAERDHTESCEEVEGLVLLREKRYGRTIICLYQAA